MIGDSFRIYNASAGSGKTHTLTKEYLKITLTRARSFGAILALTFTNKAVGEMKYRILDSLAVFGKTDGQETPGPLFVQLCEELGLEPDTLRKKARQTLKEILHNYAFFDVSTIDKFTHRLIRTFAKDLKIPQNFEVVLDSELLLAEAVSRLLLQAGKDKELTEVLVAFALEKIDDDKSWDIALDLQRIGKLAFNENHAAHLHKLRDKSISDFKGLQKQLLANGKAAQEHMRSEAREILALIENNGLVFGDFKGGYFPKYIEKIVQGADRLDFESSWRADFGTKPLYNKSCPEATQHTIDTLLPSFIKRFEQIKKAFYDHAFYKNVYGNLVPLTVLNSLQKEIQKVLEEKDQLSIAQFNTIISEEIKDQPAPFIYERLGEKYRHYFIDEFQDTSSLQWQNLVPLISNALESQDEQGQTGSLFLVGDAKQAIYRWRGGKAEQFIDLVAKRHNPFTIAPVVTALPTNYRSAEEIVRFTNDFFTTSAVFMDHPLYEQLYIAGNQQLPTTKKGGLIDIQFIDEQAVNDKKEGYGAAALAIIEEVRAKGYGYKDICILVRNHKDGVAMADVLTQQELPVVSSESLLLKSNGAVRFLIHLLQLQNQPDDLAVAYELLAFLSQKQTDRHRFISEHLHDIEGLFRDRYDFDLTVMKQKSVYDGLEIAIRQFELATDTQAYLLFFMDTVLDVEQTEGTGIQAFLSYWEKKQDTLGLSAPEHLNAIQIMTVHKAKGLEFPIVIFPYANEHLYKRMEKKLWLPVSSTEHYGFEEVLVSEKKEVVHYGETAGAHYREEEQKMELDAFNVLYVALTRAEQALYVISKKQLDAAGNPNTDYYSGLFISFLQQKGMWNTEQDRYLFGALGMGSSKSPVAPQKVSYPYTYKERPGFRLLASAGNLWDTEREAALNKGNLVHHAMGMITHGGDIEKALRQLSRNGDIPTETLDTFEQSIRRIVEHPELKPYFEIGNTVKNEKDIITGEGRLLRPDRLVFHGNKVTIIDYKTGQKNKSYHQQLEAYAVALEAMGHSVENKIIVYINDTITPEFI